MRDRAFVCNGAIRALAKAQSVGAQVTGMADGTDLETTERSTGGGQVTRQRRSEDTRGRVHALEITVYGWNVLLLIEATTKIPLEVKVGTIQEQETHGTRALVTQARATLAGAARRHTVVVARGVWEGTAWWWLDQQGLTCVVPAKDHLEGTADARAQTVVGEEITVGRRVHRVRHGQGREAWTERLETEVVGMTGLTTDDQDGTPAHGRQGHHRDVQATPINAVVVRQGNGRDDGPAGHTVFLPDALVDKLLRPFDDDDDRRLIEHCCITEAKQPWELGHLPQNTDRAVRVHVLFTLLLFALATAYRRPCERDAMGGEPVGWQRRRRQLLEQTREQVILCAQGDDGIFHLAEYSLLLGVKRKDLAFPFLP